MGKASSAKKVAKAARVGGRASGVRQRNLLFPGIIAGIVLAGTGLIFYARSEHQETATNVAPTVGEHWHAAYDIFICDDFLPTTDFYVSNEVPEGIHSHGDGIIHIHPFSRAASGENARMEVFLDSMEGLEVDSDKIVVGDQEWVEGESTCEVDGEDVVGEVVLAQWDDVLGDSNYALRTDIRDERFRLDGEGFVFAFVPEGETDDIGEPRSVDTLSQVLGSEIESAPGQEIDPEDLPDDVSQEELDEILGDAGATDGGGATDPAGPVLPDAGEGDTGDDAESGDGSGDSDG